jgi:hypothetical protein
MKNIDLNIDRPKIDFIEVHIFYQNDNFDPIEEIEITVFIKKDDNMPISELINASVARARQTLSHAASVPETEWHHTQSL